MFMCSCVLFVGCSCGDQNSNASTSSDEIDTAGNAGNITLKCYYNDGTYRYYTQEVKAGAEITFKEIYRDGYYIDNWYIGGAGGELLISNNKQKKLTKSTELWARWFSYSYNDPHRLSPEPKAGYVVVKYFMNFDSDDNNTFVNDYIESGSVLQSFQDPRNMTSDGKIFLSWHYDRECSPSQKFEFSNTPITSNLNLYAKWGHIS